MLGFVLIDLLIVPFLLSPFTGWSASLRRPVTPATSVFWLANKSPELSR